MKDIDFEGYAIQVDSDCVDKDFDDYDLYGEIMKGDNDSYGEDIEFE